MRLHQLSWSPHKSVYTTESGQVLYKVDTPKTLRNQISTISRVLPSANAGSSSQPDASTSTVIYVPFISAKDSQGEEYELASLRQRSKKAVDAFETDQDEENGMWARYDSDSESRKSVRELVPDDESVMDMQDRFEVIARIEWSLFTSSVIDWGDRKDKTSNFFTRSGFGAMGPGKQWTGPDGRTYKWEMGFWTPSLVLVDGSSPPPVIARFHRAPFLKPNDQEWLEISPQGEHMVDTILITYVYVERIRKNRERAARHNGGGGP